MQITLICDETPGLKLGPGFGSSPEPGTVIVFRNATATFDAKDFPKWEEWVNAPGTPHIEVVADDGQVSVSSGVGFECPTCGKSFGTQKQLNGHRMHHPR
jgi:hypothetical protein